MRKKPSYVRRLQNTLSPNARLEQIVDHGMCIGCGICQSVAEEVVQIEIGEDMTPRPVARGTMDETTIDRIVSVCPGTRVEGLPETLVEPDSAYDEVWGIWRQMKMAHAKDPEVRFRGSTGGLLTALALFLLDSKSVDFILHARASDTHPTLGERTISRTAEDVIDAAGSRYAPTPTLIDVLQILSQCESTGESFAFIGTPCDVTALRNMAQQDPRVNQYCRYQLTMVCGGFMSADGMNGMLNEIDVESDQIQSLRYRGHGCPGSTRIEMKDRSVHELDYLDFWGEDDSKWSLPHRCKICPDGIGDAADIAAADAWEGGAPEREAQHADPGSNSTIVRTLAGEKLLAAAADAGYVTTGATLTPRDMDRFQPHQVRKKQSVWARFVGMRAAGAVVPDVRGLRLKPLARRNSLKDNLAQAKGGRNRARKLLGRQ